MNRWKAALVHLMISLLIAGTATLFIRFILYPDYYFFLSGGLTLLFLIVGVDIVMGPMMTLVVWGRGKAKKALVFDLCVIAFLQLSALCYGIHTTWLGRPLYNVFVVDRFQVVTEVNLDPDSLKKADPLYQNFPKWGPRLVGAQMPVDPQQQYQLAMSAMAGSDIENYPQYYVAFDDKVKSQVAQKGKPLTDLRARNADAQKLVDNFLNGRDINDFRYLPIKGFAPEFMSLIVAADGTPVTAIAVDPWAVK